MMHNCCDVNNPMPVAEHTPHYNAKDFGKVCKVLKTLGIKEPCVVKIEEFRLSHGSRAALFKLKFASEGKRDVCEA